MATEESLIALLDELEARLPKMIDDNPDHGDFWREFTDKAGVIENLAGNYCELVNRRISLMLAKHGRYIATVDTEDT